MPVDSIDVWDDPRVKKLSAILNGINYGGSTSAVHLRFACAAVAESSNSRILACRAGSASSWYHFSGKHGGAVVVGSSVEHISQVHGYPDLSAGWKNQIPMLLELRLRVVAIDCIGYGRTVGPSRSDGQPPWKLADICLRILHCRSTCTLFDGHLMTLLS